MKKALLAIALGLSSNAVLAADTGEILFAGSIKPGGTCPIDLVIPGTGGVPIPRVEVGNFRVDNFPKTGTKSTPIPFALRVTPGAGCTIGTDDGYLTFTPGWPTGNTRLYGLEPNGAEGIALAILDRNLDNVEPGKESIAYPLDDTLPTDMKFYAQFESTSDTVTDGFANTRVEYSFEHK